MKRNKKYEVTAGALNFYDLELGADVTIILGKIVERYRYAKQTDSTRKMLAAEIRHALVSCDIQDVEVNVSVRVEIAAKNTYLFTDKGMQKFQLSPAVLDHAAVDITFLTKIRGDGK